MSRESMLVGLFVALLAFGLSASAAGAAISEEDPWGEAKCPPGSAAGECRIPRGIAADPADGHIFVADQSNRRVVELNARGEFLEAWGWGVDTGAAELQVCTEASGCQAGLPGSGAGQLQTASPQGVAVDSAGNVYVVDRGIPSNARVQKFDPDGNFLLMFGGEVNKTKVEEGTATEQEENVCPFDPGDECQGGSEGTGSGQFGEWPVVGSFIAIDPADNVYVGDVGRIQRFDSDGLYQDECAVAGTVDSLAADASGNLYRGGNPIRKLDYGACEVIPPAFQVTTPNGDPAAATAVAVGSDNHVFAFGPISFSAGNKMDPLFEFDPAGNVLDTFGIDEYNASTGLATNLCAGSEAPGNLYVANSNFENAFVRAYGTEPLGCFKARTLPASDIEETAATLNGTVTPKGEAVTECFFEWGTTAAYGETAPCVPGAAEIGTGEDPVAVHADIAGLDAGTVYHFRLVAEVGGETELGSDEELKTLGPPVISAAHTADATHEEATVKALVNPEGFATTYRFEYLTEAAFEAAGGGFEGAQSTPAVGIGSERADRTAQAVLRDLEPGTAYRWRILATNASGESEAEGAVVTYRPFAAETDCPNQALRSGSSAFLPDCRAYEMVSPVDKNGIDVAEPAALTQASPDGERITYTVAGSFAGQPAARGSNQYLSSRAGVAGWSTAGIQVPVTADIGDPLNGFGTGFQAFSPDLCSSWQVDPQDPPPTLDGQGGSGNTYRRVNCGAGSGGLEAIIPDPPVAPAGGGPIQGVSEDSRHAVFVATAALPHAPEANEGTNAQTYLRFCPLAPLGICRADTPGSQIRLVSVLPSGEAATVGTAVGSDSRNLDNAVSADGSRVYWTSVGGNNVGKGTIYQRRHPAQGVGDEDCADIAKACTTQVSGVETPFPAEPGFFWTASEDATKALYSEASPGGESLYLFEEGQPRRLLAADTEGVAGAAEDLSRVYFVSREALTGEAAAGEPNLYLDSEGAPALVATLAEGDLAEPYDVGADLPVQRPTRVSPDGSHLAFQSRAPLTGFDSSDPVSGEAATEVFLYETGGELLCVSCNPSGARPAARLLPAFPNKPRIADKSDVRAAGWIPTWQRALHDSRLLAEDGSRLFFNSNDPLLPRDTNGAQDVYEWEAPGAGSCTEASPSYFEQNGGCLYLISSGESPSESEFWEASADGRDVFFTTESSLLPQDPGLIDLYDARAGGGVPQPAQQALCEGEACQSPPAPPQRPTPASRTFQGPGNLSATRDCRAVARRAARLSRRAKRARRAAGRAKRTGSRATAVRMRGRAKRLARSARKQSRNAKRCRRANRRARR